MLTAQENELLCRVEGDAPMGQIMRRHWLPACLIEEVEEPDCDPVKVRLCGKDLVVFRDTNGKLGILDELCPHRRASLAFGRNEECGLRCLYHGWKFDVDGNAMELASEPAETGLVKKVKTKSYPGARGRGLRVGLSGPGGNDAGVRTAGVPAGARTRASRSPSSACRATGRRSSRAASTRRIPRRCTRPTWCRRASRARRPTTRTGCGPRPTSRRACRCSARPSASATPRCAARCRMRRRTITSAPRSSSRHTPSTFRRTTITKSPSCTCRWTTRTRISTSCASAIRRRRRRRRRGASSWARRAAST